jgi:cytochrome c-type biogenesis protein CcmH
VIRVLVVTSAALVLAAQAAAACTHPRANLITLEGEVMCPVCHTTLDQSDSPTAEAIKRFVRTRIAACETSGQIKQELVDSFGPAILAAPPKKGFDLLAWWLPLGGIVVAAVAIAAGVWHWSRKREAGDESALEEQLDPELERRVDDALARFEA